MKKIAFYTLIAAYFFAGLYHFVNPAFYSPFFPPYLQQWTATLNILAGIAEILLAILLLFPSTKKIAIYALMAMLVAFIPAHVYMIQKAPFMLGKFHVTTTIAWVRLLVLHPILILWVWWVRK